jgi:hypothetical protein
VKKNIKNTPMLRDKITETFVKVDDFCNEFEILYSKHQLPAPSNVKTRNRKAGMCDSEIITLLIAFHGGQFRNFKHFYVDYVSVHLREDFPGLVSYNRFIELSHRCAIAQVHADVPSVCIRTTKHKIDEITKISYNSSLLIYTGHISSKETKPRCLNTLK